MDMPKAAGGKGEGTNPEQLFGMGYASKFPMRRVFAVTVLIGFQRASSVLCS